MSNCPHCGVGGGQPHTFACPEVTNETNKYIIYRHKILRTAFEKDPGLVDRKSPQEIIDDYEAVNGKYK